MSWELHSKNPLHLGDEGIVRNGCPVLIVLHDIRLDAKSLSELDLIPTLRVSALLDGQAHVVVDFFI